MLERFRSHLDASGLIPPNSVVLVGYSGGADSTALLHLLKLSQVDVIAGHLHHGQRPEAEDELSRCRQFAESLDIPFVSGIADVPRIGRDLGIGLEEAGRKARYSFFSEAAFKLQCDLIATAHTQTDRIETVLLNMIRGCGLHGLQGIPERRENIIRPLIPFTREETQNYCRERGFWTHDDPSNTDIDFSRARVRHLIVPEMRSINSNLESAIVRLSDIAKEEDEFLNGMAASMLEQCEIPLNGGLKFLTEDAEIRLDHARFSHYPYVLVKRGLRLASEALGAPLTYEQTTLATNGIQSEGKGSISAEGGQVVIEWNGSWIDIRKLTSVETFREPVTYPGDTISDELGWQLTAFETTLDSNGWKRADMTTQISLDAIKGSLYLRTAQSGDLMQPYGFDGRRKLTDILSDAKLTLAAKQRLPIVCDMVGPLWVPGICLDNRASRTTGSNRVIRLQFGPLES